MNPNKPLHSHLQEKFVQELVKNKGNQRQAYLGAGYSNQKGNMDLVDQKASRLLSEVKVKSRYEYLYNKMNKVALDKVQWTVDDSLRELMEAYKTAKDSGQLKYWIGGVKEINNMMGFNAKNINTVNTELNYADYLKELEGKKF
jgi:phage terminase small subunit